MSKESIKMTPGDDTHLTLLMAPVSLNLVTGQDREHLLAYGRAAFEAGQKCQGCDVPKDGVYQISEPSHSMSQYASKDDMLKAVMAENEQLRAQLAAVQQGVQAVVPDNWRDQFSEYVYEDLSAACNQDVPLEEYPARILNILDAIVGPRHPAVIKWRNDAIRSCIAIAYKYCSDPDSHRYLKQDLEAMLAAPAHPADGVQPSDKDLRDKVARALGCGTGTNYAWSYLLKQIESLVECEEEFIAMKQSTHPTQQGLDAMNHAIDAMQLALSSHGIQLLSYPPQDALASRCVDEKLRTAISALAALAAQAKKGGA